jgi:hypothetical protein
MRLTLFIRRQKIISKNSLYIYFFISSFLLFTSQEAISDDKTTIKTSYGISTDLEDDLRPRIYDHKISISGNYDYLGFELFASTAISYKTVGSTLVRNSQKRNGVSWDSATFGMTTKLPFKSINTKRNELAIESSITLPISDEARYFGYYSLPAVGLSLTSNFFNKQLLLINSGDVTYYHAKYSYIQTIDEEMPLADLSYNVTAIYSPVSNIKFSYSAGFTKTIYKKNSKPIKFQNRYSITYSLDNFSMAGSYTNCTTLDKEAISLWYIEKDRKMASLRLSYAF